MLLYDVRLRNLNWAIIALIAIATLGFTYAAILAMFYGLMFWFGVRETHANPFPRPIMAWVVLPMMMFSSKGNVPAFMFYMAMLYIAMRLTLRYAKFDWMARGIIGEQDVATALTSCRQKLASNGQMVYIRNNALLCRGDGSTVEIDHVVVGGDWLYVVETKSIRGTIGYNASNNSLYRDDEYLRPNPVSQLRNQVSMVCGLVPEAAVYSVVCFTDAQPGYDAENAPHVVFGVKELQKDVMRVAQERDRFSQPAASGLNRKLASFDIGRDEERQAHADRVYAKHGGMSPSPAGQRMAIKIAAVLSVIVTAIGSAGLTASLAPNTTFMKRYPKSLEAIQAENKAKETCWMTVGGEVCGIREDRFAGR
jgi:hypothetical protein